MQYVNVPTPQGGTVEMVCIHSRGASLADKIRKMENFFVLPYAGHAYEYIFTNITPIGSAIHISQEM